MWSNFVNRVIFHDFSDVLPYVTGQKQLPMGQLIRNNFSLKCEYTLNQANYDLQTLFTEICPYKSGLIS